MQTLHISHTNLCMHTHPAIRLFPLLGWWKAVLVLKRVLTPRLPTSSLLPSFLYFIHAPPSVRLSPHSEYDLGKRCQTLRARTGTHAARDGDGEEEGNNDVRRAVCVWLCRMGSSVCCVRTSVSLFTYHLDSVDCPPKTLCCLMSLT